MKRQKIKIENGEKCIAAEVVVPDALDALDAQKISMAPETNRAKLPTVIISHGFGESYRSTAKYALALVNEGFACVTFDFCGGSEYSESSGSILDMSVISECEDLLFVIEEIGKMDFVDGDRVFLMGNSQGGMVTAMVASRLARGEMVAGNSARETMVKSEMVNGGREELPAGLVLFYPAFVIPDDARKRHRNRTLIGDRGRIMGIPIGRRYNEDVYEMDVWQEIKDYHGPVLLIHGTSDSIVPISYSRKANSIYSDSELVEIAGAGHGFYGADFDKAMHETSEFLQKRAF